MDLGLQGSRALVTGESKGIGFAIADALAAEGAAVGLVAGDAAGGGAVVIISSITGLRPAPRTASAAARRRRSTWPRPPRKSWHPTASG